MQKLEWDTDYFGIPVYDTWISESRSVSDLAQFALRRLVYVHLAEENSHLSKELESLGAVLVDTRLYYRKEIGNVNFGELEDVWEYQGDLTEEMEQLAWRAGEYSRFHRDAKLNQYFKDFYSRWIFNSLNQGLADKVFVIGSGGKIVGLATCKVNAHEGLLGLISVSDEFQGQGSGAKLLFAVEQFYKECNVNYSIVITQRANINACMFYEALGYQQVKRELIFHLWQE